MSIVALLLLIIFGLSLNYFIKADSVLGTPVLVASNKTVRYPVVVSIKASTTVLDSAQMLADTLSQVTGAQFAVIQGDGATGIAVGKTSDFAWPSDVTTDIKSTDEFPENYVLRSHSHGIYVAGVSDQAVSDAVWDLLNRIGYRQYFPGKNWEIIPHIPNLTVSVNAKEKPAYITRNFATNYGLFTSRVDFFNTWLIRNRMNGAFDDISNHIYSQIIREFPDDFAKHPEYLSKDKNGKSTTKFCVLNPGLQDIVKKHIDRYENLFPERQSFSLEASDNSDWGTCGTSEDSMSISDRVVTLANVGAKYVQQKYPGKYITILSYNLHSTPPTIKLEPNVVVNIATGYVQGTTLSVPDRITAWLQKGFHVGLREYYGINVLDRDLPGYSRGTNINYLKTTISQYNQLGAKFMIAEMSDNWAINGLGYYISSQLLWDPSKDVESLKRDFFQNSFGEASQEAQQFYTLLDDDNVAKRTFPTDNSIKTMYQKLNDAINKTNDPTIRQRLYQLVLYTRYVELFKNYSVAKGPDRQAKFEELIKFSYRVINLGIIHSRALYLDLDARDASVSIPDNATWGKPEGQNPWKDTTPFTEVEINDFIKSSVANYTAPAEVVKTPNLSVDQKYSLKNKDSGYLTYTINNNSFIVQAKKVALTTTIPDGYHIKAVSSGGTIADKTVTFSLDTFLPLQQQIFQVVIAPDSNAKPLTPIQGKINYCTQDDTDATCNPANNLYSQSSSSNTELLYFAPVKPINLKLKVKLSNHLSNTYKNSSIALKISNPADGNKIVKSTTLASEDDGTIVLSDITNLDDTVSYDIVIKPSGYLARKITNVKNILSQIISLPDTKQFIEGDFNNNNTIDLSDVGKAIYAHNGHSDTLLNQVYLANSGIPSLADLGRIIYNYNNNKEGE